MSALLKVSVGIIAGWVSIAQAQSVHVTDGNVYFVPRSGSDEVQLTSSGRDRDPSLSADGKHVAFIRRPRGDEPERDRPGKLNQLWTIDSDGKNPRLLLKGREGREPEDNLTDMITPQFSPDGTRIYFMAWGWATSHAIHVIDIQTQRTRFVTDSSGPFRIVPTGEYREHLLTCQHRHFLFGPSYNWLWLITSQGTEVGPLAPDCDAQTANRYLDELTE